MPGDVCGQLDVFMNNNCTDAANDSNYDVEPDAIPKKMSTRKQKASTRGQTEQK
jgi:hypothetical protein